MYTEITLKETDKIEDKTMIIDEDSDKIQQHKKSFEVSLWKKLQWQPVQWTVSIPTEPDQDQHQ